MHLVSFGVKIQICLPNLNPSGDGFYVKWKCSYPGVPCMFRQRVSAMSLGHWLLIPLPMHDSTARRPRWDGNAHTDSPTCVTARFSSTVLLKRGYSAVAYYILIKAMPLLFMRGHSQVAIHERVQCIKRAPMPQEPLTSYRLSTFHAAKRNMM